PRGCAKLEAVELRLADGSARQVYRAGGRVEPHDHQLVLEGGAPAALRVRLLTPLRINRRGRILGRSELTPGDLLNACARRAQLMADFHAPGALAVDFAAVRRVAESVRLEERALHWRKLSRWSNRQRQ